MDLHFDQTELKGGLMKTNLKTIDTSNLPENFPAVVEKLEALKTRVTELQQNLPRIGATTPTLESAQRDALKAKLELEGLEVRYNDNLGLDMVEPGLHDQLREVGQARNDAGTLYVECEALLDVVKPALKAMRGKATGPVLEDLESLHDEIKALIKSVQDIVRNIPELGMTFAEWNSLTPAERAGMRDPGRPTAPLEAQIIKTHRRLIDSVALVNRLSEGKLRTVEDAIAGVELSKRGRPQASPLNKMDRQLLNLRKRLEEVTQTNSNMRDKKMSRLMNQIEALEEEIRDGEAELSDVEAAKRDLERLRGKHRDMVVEEVHASGENQSALLLAIIRNEDEQLTTVDRILSLDPEARVTVTHKVNPKETRQRFERLRLNGQMKEAELEELKRLENRQFNFAYSRNR